MFSPFQATIDALKASFLHCAWESGLNFVQLSLQAPTFSPRSTNYQHLSIPKASLILTRKTRYGMYLLCCRMRRLEDLNTPSSISNMNHCWSSSLGSSKRDGEDVKYYGEKTTRAPSWGYWVSLREFEKDKNLLILSMSRNWMSCCSTGCK